MAYTYIPVHHCELISKMNVLILLPLEIKKGQWDHSSDKILTKLLMIQKSGEYQQRWLYEEMEVRKIIGRNMVSQRMWDAKN